MVVKGTTLRWAIPGRKSLRDAATKIDTTAGTIPGTTTTEQSNTPAAQSAERTRFSGIWCRRWESCPLGQGAKHRRAACLKVTFGTKTARSEGLVPEVGIEPTRGVNPTGF